MLKKIKENKGWNSDNPCLGFALSHCIAGQSFEFENTKAYEEFIEKNPFGGNYRGKLPNVLGVPTDSTIEEWHRLWNRPYNDYEFKLENSKIYRIKLTHSFKASFAFNDALKKAGVYTIDLYEDGNWLIAMPSKDGMYKTGGINELDWNSKLKQILDYDGRNHDYDRSDINQNYKLNKSDYFTGLNDRIYLTSPVRNGDYYRGWNNWYWKAIAKLIEKASNGYTQNCQLEKSIFYVCEAADVLLDEITDQHFAFDLKDFYEVDPAQNPIKELFPVNGILDPKSRIFSISENEVAIG